MAKRKAKSKSSFRSNGRLYKKQSCHKNKTAAKSRAAAMRKKGMTARVVGTCVFSAGKSKTRKKKKAA